MRERLQDPHSFYLAGMALAQAEEAILLVARATPRNVFAELRRLSGDFRRGLALRPAFVYEPAPELAAVRQGLACLVREMERAGPLGALHAGRAEELELEARLVESLGSRAFSRLAARRFPGPLPALGARVDAFVRDALAGPSPAAGAAPRFASDDAVSPESLLCQVRRQARELALPLRIEIRTSQLATAATGAGVVAIRPGVPLSAATGRRIALHELLGHALPRARAVHVPWTLLRAGTKESVEHEEGRALLIEARAGLLDRERRRELALRHVAATGVRNGADFHETVAALVAHGAGPQQALEVAARVHRGGGLAREIVYLPSYHAVADALGAEPELERWFEQGRVGLDAARALSALTASEGEGSSGYAPSSISTGV